MLAGIQISLTSIENGLMTDTSVEAFISSMNFNHNKNVKDLDNDENGLNNYGANIQFLNSQPPNYEKNGKTADWFTCHGDVFPVGSSRLEEYILAICDISIAHWLTW